MLRPALPGDGGEADEAPGGRDERAGHACLIDGVVFELGPEGQYPERVGVDPGAERQRYGDRARRIWNEPRCGGSQAAEHDQVEVPLAQSRAGADAEPAQVLRPADGDGHQPAGERPKGQFGESRDDESVNGNLVARAPGPRGVAWSVHRNLLVHCDARGDSQFGQEGGCGWSTTSATMPVAEITRKASPMPAISEPDVAVPPAAMVASTAMPMVPPISWPVVFRPESMPLSSSSVSVMTDTETETSTTPRPRPVTSMPGRTSAR